MIRRRFFGWKDCFSEQVFRVQALACIWSLDFSLRYLKWVWSKKSLMCLNQSREIKGGVVLCTWRGRAKGKAPKAPWPLLTSDLWLVLRTWYSVL
jgi:hypothetical protein